MTHIPVETHPLGRLEAPDERDENYHMSMLLTAKERQYKYWWPSGLWHNQGATPSCVGAAWTHWAEDGPLTQPNIELDPFKVYKEAQTVDEWDGTNYDGTSVRAGAKILQRHNIIENYWWAWDFDTFARAVSELGPVVLGTHWLSSMFYPDDKGFIKVEGRMVGGHAYVANGINFDREIVRFKNSWGRGWGRKGFFYMTFDNVQKLFTYPHAEVCIATERRV